MPASRHARTAVPLGRFGQTGSAQVVAEEALIRDAFRRYQQAFAEKDLNALREVDRSLTGQQARALARQFGSVKHYSLGVRIDRIAAAPGKRATTRKNRRGGFIMTPSPWTARVTARVTSIVTRKDGQVETSPANMTVFHMIKRKEGWLITRKNSQ